MQIDTYKLDNLFMNQKQIKLHQDDIFHDVHEKCRSLGKVSSGRLRLSRILSSGREIILKEFLPGELIGELLMFTGNFYPGWLIATEETTIVEVPFSSVLDFLRESDSLISFMNSIALKNNHLVDKIEILSFKTVKEKIAFSLLLYGELKITSVKELADNIVCSREALSRTISEMEKDGMIQKKADRILVADEFALEDLF